MSGPDGYFLQRNLEASVRLSLQHFLLRQKNGWAIHPDIAAHLSTISSPRIADISTGNCIWAFETAQRYPQATIAMTDISDQQLPHRDYWPANATFTAWDFTQPPAPEFVGAFDFVHLAIVSPFVRDGVEPLMKNLLSLLKPDGYLQWMDLKWHPARIVHPVSDGTCLADLIQAMGITGWEWANDIAGGLNGHGFKDAKPYTTPSCPWLARYESECLGLVLDEMVALRKVRGAPNQEKCEEVLQRCRNEITRGGHFEYNVDVVVARK